MHVEPGVAVPQLIIPAFVGFEIAERIMPEEELEDELDDELEELDDELDELLEEELEDEDEELEELLDEVEGPHNATASIASAAIFCVSILTSIISELVSGNDIVKSLFEQFVVSSHEFATTYSRSIDSRTTTLLTDLSASASLITIRLALINDEKDKLMNLVSLPA